MLPEGETCYQGGSQLHATSGARCRRGSRKPCPVGSRWRTINGRLAEWSKAPALKAGNGSPFAGSNPSHLPPEQVREVPEWPNGSAWKAEDRRKPVQGFESLPLGHLTPKRNAGSWPRMSPGAGKDMRLSTTHAQGARKGKGPLAQR